jgi:hypothetical protein
MLQRKVLHNLQSKGLLGKQAFFWVVWVMVGSWFFSDMTQRKSQQAPGFKRALGHLGHECITLK